MRANTDMQILASYNLIKLSYSPSPISLLLLKCSCYCFNQLYPILGNFIGKFCPCCPVNLRFFQLLDVPL